MCQVLCHQVLTIPDATYRNKFTMNVLHNTTARNYNVNIVPEEAFQVMIVLNVETTTNQGPTQKFPTLDATAFLLINEAIAPKSTKGLLGEPQGLFALSPIASGYYFQHGPGLQFTSDILFD